ncbi:MAG: hypothetical protein WDW38_009858 [Sanguina aurantia]
MVRPAAYGRCCALTDNLSEDENDLHIHRLLRENRQRITIPQVDEEQFLETCFPDSEPEPSSSSPPSGCPVYVMLPLDTVWVVDRDGKRTSVLKKERTLDIALHTLKQAGVAGVMVDVWWGIVERDGPQKYDLSAYKSLFYKVGNAGLKAQAVMSFHAAGGNVGDTCKILLPSWVLDVGETNPDIYFTDKTGHRNRECLSLGCAEEALFSGRTPVEMYHDFVAAFADKFQHLFGEHADPIGLLAQGGMYWGLSGPHDAGHYNSSSWETGFFVSQGGSWNTTYGHFFLEWYSGALARHVDRVLGSAARAMYQHGRPRVLKALTQATSGHIIYEFQPACHLGIKLAGVHWWFKSRAHAAELTAGYYNTRDRNGYEPLMLMLKKHSSRLSFTCVEMRDCEHPPEGRCSPQALLQQVLDCAEQHGVPLAGENALQRYDDYAFDRIAESAFGRNARAGRLEQVTFLRMGDLMFDNWDAFSRFLSRMRSS